MPGIVEARSTTIVGTAVAPATGGGQLSLPVILTQGSQKKLRATSPVVRLTFAKGKLPKLRAGDTMSGKATVPKKSKKPKTLLSLRLRNAKLVSRDSQFSNDELLSAIGAVASQFGTLQSGLGALQSRIATLETKLTELQTQVQVPGQSPDVITGLQNQINDLLAQITALTNAVNLLQPLQGQVNGILAQLAGLPGGNLAGLQSNLQGQITGLTTQVGQLKTGLCGNALVNVLLTTAGFCP